MQTIWPTPDMFHPAGIKPPLFLGLRLKVRLDFLDPACTVAILPFTVLSPRRAPQSPRQESAGSPAIGRFLCPMVGLIAKSALSLQSSALVASEMKRCAQCHGKLGLGVRFRNLWNGRWWVHLRFCSSYCETLYDLVCRDQVARSRWHNFLADGSP